MNRITFTTPKGEAFIAEFDREVCASMEERNLTPQRLAERPAATLLTFFYWAFKKNHPKVKKDVTDEIWGGLSREAKRRSLLLLRLTGKRPATHSWMNRRTIQKR